jgi:hypothetical protein
MQRHHVRCKCKDISYALVKPELQAITHPVRFPGRVGAKILGSTGGSAVVNDRYVPAQ